MSDYKGADMLLDAMPSSKVLLADRGYDSDKFRNDLRNKGITPCIPPRKNRKVKIHYDKKLYKQRYKVECMSGKNQRLEKNCYKTWQMCTYLFLKHHHRCNSGLLSELILMFMSP